MKALGLFLAWLALALAVGAREPPVRHVLFVCEHGSVKSAMAALMLDRIAAERGLPVRGMSRGIAVTDGAMPDAIAGALAADGIDGTGFEAQPLRQRDIDEAALVVLIGVQLPPSLQPNARPFWSWSDVPAATQDYAAARAAILEHLEVIAEGFETPRVSPSPAAAR